MSTSRFVPFSLVFVCMKVFSNNYVMFQIRRVLVLVIHHNIGLFTCFMYCKRYVMSNTYSVHSVNNGLDKMLVSLLLARSVGIYALVVFNTFVST